MDKWLQSHFTKFLLSLVVIHPSSSIQFPLSVSTQSTRIGCADKLSICSEKKSHCCIMVDGMFSYLLLFHSTQHMMEFENPEYKKVLSIVTITLAYVVLQMPTSYVHIYACLLAITLTYIALYKMKHASNTHRFFQT